MSNLDALVTKDLAAAAATNRDRLRTLDDTLRMVATAEPVAVSRTATMAELRLLALGDVFVGRVARIAAGSTALGCALVLVVAEVLFALTLGHVRGDGPFRSLFDLVLVSPVDFFTRSLIGILLVHILATAAARVRFGRILEEEPGRLEAAVARLDRAAIAMPIIGPLVFLMVVGVAFATLGYENLRFFGGSFSSPFRGYGFDEARYDDRTRDLALLVPVLVAAALAASRLYRAALTPRARWLERGATVAVGGAIFVATVAVGLAWDEGSSNYDLHGMMMAAGTTELRTVLTVTGGIGLWIALTALALWRRRRELLRIANARSPS